MPAMPDEPDQPSETVEATEAGPDRAPVEIPLPPPPDSAARCPWCSAVLADPGAPTCPSCGAQLVAQGPVDIPGLTEVPREILALAARPRQQKRSLGSLIIGDDSPEIPPPTKEELPALAPPDAKVRREMRRLELEALGYVIAPDRPEDVAAAAEEPPPDVDSSEGSPTDVDAPA
jgi:hypothetical protein